LGIVLGIVGLTCLLLVLVLFLRSEVHWQELLKKLIEYGRPGEFVNVLWLIIVSMALLHKGTLHYWMRGMDLCARLIVGRPLRHDHIPGSQPYKDVLVWIGVFLLSVCVVFLLTVGTRGLGLLEVILGKKLGG